MKKSLLSLAAFALATTMFAGVVYSQLDISDVFVDGAPVTETAYTQLLNEYNSNWGYQDSATLTCDAINGNVTITSPIVQDEYLSDAEFYRLYLSPYRVGQIKWWDTSVDVSKFITKETTKGEQISFALSSAEFNPSQVYYGFIVPIDMYDGVWIPSKEICFHMDSNSCMRAEGCDALGLVVNPVDNNPENIDTELQDTHGAPCVGMDLANISHTISQDNVITLTWSAVDWEIVQIAVFDPAEEIYKSLGTVNMSDQKFSYKMQRDGEHNFMLTNGCKDVYYKADAVIKDSTIVPPATWPAENVLIIAIAAIVIYGAYTLFAKRTSN